MGQLLLPLLLVFGSLALVIASWRLAGIGSWLLAWLRGSVILCCVLSALALLFLAIELTNFKQVHEVDPLATVTVTSTTQSANPNQQSGQTFLIEIADAKGKTWYTSLKGDAWQLQLRGLAFQGISGWVTSRPVARVQTISSRYYDFSRRSDARTIKVAPSFLDSLLTSISLDSWSTLLSISALTDVVGIKTQEHLSAIVPLADGAIYRIRWARNYIAVDPANELAQSSLLSP